MWFDAVGFELRIQVTRCGKVKSKDRYVDNWPKGKRLLKGRELKCSTSKNGYKVVDLRSSSKSKGARSTFYLHRIISQTFIENKHNLDTVNHIDGNKLNNNVDNLEWCTKEYNHKHAWESGLCNSKKKPVISHKDGVGVWYPSMHSPIGCNPSLIHAAINGRQKTHRGLLWDYC